MMTLLPRRYYLLTAALLTVFSGGPVARAQNNEALPVLNPAAIRAHAEFLANDLLEGRATGSRGYELAAAYVAAQFRQYGLTSLLDGGSYLQSAPLVEATVVLPGSAMSLKRDNGTVNFEFSKDYLPGANFFNANVSLTAPLAFVGYGIDAPEYQHNDFAGVDLQGRIAVLLEGAPEQFNETARAYYGWRDTKYAQLAKLGAQSVIEIDAAQSGSDGRPSSWEKAVNASWISEMRAVQQGDQPNESFPELKLKFRMSSDAAAQLFVGNGHSFEQAMQATQSGASQGFALSGALTLTATTGLRRVDSSNVIGMVRGSDARLRNEYVLVVAHLDHLGRGPTVNGDNIYNGLQRNAVGVAMMMEMARAIAAAPVKPKRSIVFAAVTAGDKQGQGLQYLLSSGVINARNIVGAFAFDMPLPLTRTQDVQAPGAAESSIGVTLASVLRQSGQSLSASNVGTLLNETLMPLLRANIPVVDMRSGNRARSARINMRMLKRQWFQDHFDQPSDDINGAALDAQAASELAAVGAVTVLHLADSDSRPTWYRSSFMSRKLRQE